MNFGLWLKLLMGLAAPKAWLALMLGSVGVGGSGGGSGSSGSTTSVPKWLRPFEKELGALDPKLLAQYNITNDPNRLAVQQSVTNDLSGMYLDPATNPTLAPSAAAIKSNAADYLGTQLQGIDDSAAGAGMEMTSKNVQNQDQAARMSTQDVTNQLAQLYGQNYATERGNMIGARTPAMNLSDYPLATAEQILQLIMSGNKKTNQSAYNVSGQGSASASYGPTGWSAPS